MAPGANPAFPFRVGRTKVLASFHEHTHDYSELVVILGGTGTHLVQGARHFVSAGDVYVFQGDASHGFVDCHELEMCNLAFGPALLEPAAAYLKKLAGFQALFVLGPPARNAAEFRCRLRLPLPELKEAERMIDAMGEEFQSRREGYEGMLSGAFTQLVAWVSRRYVAPSEPALDGVHRLAVAVSHLEKNFLEPLRLGDLAGLAGLSPRQFQRIFKAHYGTTPIDYALKLRIHHACRLLRDLETPVVDIAGASGFSDGNYFARQFRRVMGMSPGAWRRRDVSA